MKALLAFLWLLAGCTLLQAQPIQSAEYFFDTDPGYGNGIAIPITQPGENVVLQADIPVANLAAGLHHLYVRTRNGQGQWSLPETRLVYVAAVNAYAASSLKAAEYFFDEDPGVGEAYPVSLTGVGLTNSLNVLIGLGALTPGFHQLYFRVQNTDGHWSLVESRPFYVTAAQAAPVAAAEYFLDTDPGHGAATPMVLAPGNSVHLVADVTLPPAQPGIHYLYVRTRSADGAWSLVESRVLYVVQRERNAAITAAEYFFDTDPGHGAAQPLDIVSGDTLRLVGEIELPFHQPGLHQLYVRTSTADGVWSLVESRPVYVTPRLNPKVVGAEYFFNEDPGHGQGTPIALTSADGQPTAIDVNTSHLPLGFHQLYVRNRTEAGVWSLVESRLFYISQSLNNWVQAEYFFDDKDPGVGKAVPVNLDLSSTTNLLLVPVPDTMQPGVHTITLRARNGTADWDFSETKPFIVEALPRYPTGEDVLPVKLAFFRGRLQQNEVVLQWKTDMEEHTGIFEVERSANGLQFTTIGTVSAVGSANGHLYGFTDKSPGSGAQYYRLKHTDRNGKVTYSGVLYFYVSALQSPQLYPNPAITSVFVSLSNPAMPATLRVIGNHGQVVYSTAVQNKNVAEIPVQHLPNGHYFVEISQGKEVQTLPFIKR